MYDVCGDAHEAVQRVGPVHADSGLVLLEFDELPDLALDGVEEPYARRPWARRTPSWAATASVISLNIFLNSTGLGIGSRTIFCSLRFGCFHLAKLLKQSN